MNQCYDILMQIKFNHSYFNGAHRNVFTLVPTNPTKQLMDKNDIRLIDTHARLQLTVSSERDDDSIKLSYKVAEQIDLYFLIQAQDLYLDNYSILPQRTKQEAMFFSNTLAKTNNSLENQVVEFARNKLTLAASLITEQKVTDLQGISYHIPFHLEDQFYQVDISSLEPSVYSIKTTEGDKYFTTISTGMGSKPWGLLHLDTGRCLNESGQLTSPTYEINISTLSTYWRYIITEKQIIQFPESDTLIIEASDGSVTFERQIKEGILTFTSSAPIKLAAKKEVSFRLKKRNGSSTQSSVLIQNLPLPNTKTLINKDKDKIYSPIFIKL